jgi:hypothetical protein
LITATLDGAERLQEDFRPKRAIQRSAEEKDRNQRRRDLKEESRLSRHELHEP